MNPMTLVQLPRELLPQAGLPLHAGLQRPGPELPAPPAAPEQRWGTAVALVALCAAIAFALPL